MPTCIEPDGKGGVCAGAESEHPEPGWVRFEWAETARPGGWWYYRTADLEPPPHLRRDHPFRAV